MSFFATISANPSFSSPLGSFVTDNIKDNYCHAKLINCSPDSPLHTLELLWDSNASMIHHDSIYVIGEGRCFDSTSLCLADDKYSSTSKSIAHHFLNCYLTRPERIIDFNGTYSFILIDTTKGIVSVYSDRFGSQKLYFTLSNRNLFLSSEIRPILSVDQSFQAPDWATVYTYLFRNYRYAYSTTSTFFEQIKSVEPSSVTSFTNHLTDISQTRLRQSENVSPIELTDQQAIDQFKSTLRDALITRLSDTNNSEAYLLSGGLDSPTVAALAASIRPPSNPIKCYSLCFPESSSSTTELFYDESPLIKEIVASSNMNWEPIYVDSDGFLDTYDSMLEYHDEPISSPTWYSHWKMLQAISNDGHNIIFGGDGGDHILAGLYDDFPYFFADLYSSGDSNRLNNELKAWIEMHSHPVFPKTIELWYRYRDSCFDWNTPGSFHACTWDESMFRASLDYGSLSIYPISPSPSISCFSNSYLISKLHQDLVFTSSPPSSKAEVPNLKAFGIELRSALLDHQLVDFCWNLPNRFMIRDGFTKYLIRIAMKDLLPPSVLWNKKHTGLNSPANIWFRNDLKSLISDTIKWEAWYDLKILDYSKTISLLNDHLDSKADHMMFLWKLFSLKRWFEYFGNI
tara:strand:+ start:1717 stop:3600 length:1884 start_codon:yes stop_codon:yes gene_type:complete